MYNNIFQYKIALLFYCFGLEVILSYLICYVIDNTLSCEHVIEILQI